jgi:hypothetical protein
MRDLSLSGLVRLAISSAVSGELNAYVVEGQGVSHFQLHVNIGSSLVGQSLGYVFGQLHGCAQLTATLNNPIESIPAKASFCTASDFAKSDF